MGLLLAYLRKDLRLEFRRGYAIGGLMLFVLCIVYLVYLTFGTLEGSVWITLYWIAFLFVGIQTILKGFALEQGQQYIYYYQLLRPETLFLAKWSYHTLVLGTLGFVMYGALFVVAGDPFADRGLFLLCILLGAVGVSMCFTFVSAIAVKSDHSATLMTVLAFPLIIPVLLHLIRLSRAALPGGDIIPLTPGLLTLAAVFLLMAGVGLLLFPYLWRS
jgi:heme exporter protein B